MAKSVSEKIKNNEYLAKLQATSWLFCALCAPGHHTANRRKTVNETTMFLLFLLVNLPSIHRV